VAKGANSSTKERILAAAEELITEKGIDDTTIAEIARKADVAGSLAYQYFKGKHGLLFAVAYERLNRLYEVFEEQLQGITDPKSLIGKFIWNSLKYQDEDHDYVRNLMFEYRASEEYYSTPAHDATRKHAAQTMKILKQGVADGLFRDDVNLEIVRDIIYGTLDYEAISCVVIREIDESIKDWASILSLLFAIIEKKGESPTPTKRDIILNAAEDVFNELGYRKAGIVKIAKAAGVAEGSIYDYFNNKKNLLLSVSEKYLNSLNEQIPETFHVSSPMRKLRRFIRYYFTHAMKNRKFLKVFVTDTLLNIDFYDSTACKAHKRVLSVLDEIMEEGKAAGVFRPEVNVRVFKNMMLGAFTHMTLRWLFIQGKKFDKMAELDHLLDLLVRAVAANQCEEC
jgi:TetR/AcrR family fatty acid metabolism transcriptional regulator